MYLYIYIYIWPNFSNLPFFRNFMNFQNFRNSPKPYKFVWNLGPGPIKPYEVVWIHCCFRRSWSYYQAESARQSRTLPIRPSRTQHKWHVMHDDDDDDDDDDDEDDGDAADDDGRHLWEKYQKTSCEEQHIKALLKTNIF